MAIVQHFIHSMNITRFFYTLSSSLMVAALVSCSATLTPAEIRRVQRFERYLQAAKAGDAVAQSRVGDAYEKGNGVDYDSRKAEKWYRLAAEQGNTYAQAGLCRMYGSNGVFANENPSECVKWAMKFYENPESDENDKGLAAIILTICYREGYGVEKDLKKREEWAAKTY